MSPNYRVIAIEPFGYGLSDWTDKERTTENIITEIHEAVQALDIDQYILMGHSITGLYGIEYVNKYRDEVTAFAGIDSSVPTQPGMDAKLPIRLFGFLKESGLVRLLSGGPDAYDKNIWSEDTRKQLNLLSLKNSFNPTMLNELKNLSSNFKASIGVTFPSDLPLILFVDTSNTGVKGWIPLHEEQIKDSIHGKTILMDGGHYLHHKNYKKIAEDFRAFMTEVEKDTAH
ncbi:haloalkane dehalogenase [compost metagenome]